MSSEFMQRFLTMDGCKGLLLLCLGLFLMFDYDNAAVPGKEEVHIYSDIFFKQNENMAEQLESLKKTQKMLEDKLKHTRNAVPKSIIEGDLFKVKNAIAHIGKTSKASYKDYLQMKMKQKSQYEKEMEEMRKKLETAKNQEKAKELALHKQNFDQLAAEKQKIEKEFADYIEATKVNEQRINQIKDRLKEEKEETMKTLEAAKQKHARALEALTANSNEGNRFVRIPQQATVNELKNDLKEFVSMKDKKRQKEGLLLTRTKLNALLPALYEGSKFYAETDRKDIEDALGVMEMNTVIVRDQQNKQRKELVEKIKNRDLTELSDEEIGFLQKINEELAVTDMFQQEVSNRSAYVKALLEVDDLIEECSDAIKASEQGKISKFLSEAIEEAKNGNLAKLWARAY